jgi:hypothetical protein
MGNIFSEEPDRPENALVLDTINLANMHFDKMKGTWEINKKKRQEAYDAEIREFRRLRREAPTMAAKREASYEIQKRILDRARTRNVTRRAVAKHLRFGRIAMVQNNTQKHAPLATRVSPLELLEFYLQTPKVKGYYTDRKKLFAHLAILNNLPKRCNTVLDKDEDTGTTVCDIILDKDHNELSKAIAAINRRTFMDNFSGIAQLYNDCEEKHKNQSLFGNQIADAGSAAVTATEEAAAIAINPAGPAMTFFQRFINFFTGYKSKSNSPPPQQQESEQSEQSRQPLSSLSQPQQSQTSTSPSTVQSIDEEMKNATAGDADKTRRDSALDLFTQLPDEKKLKLLTDYKRIVTSEPGGEREVYLDNFNRELAEYLTSKGATNQPQSNSNNYARVPNSRTASRIAASSIAAASAAGVFPPTSQGGSRTRKHKRKPRHSK